AAVGLYLLLHRAAPIPFQNFAITQVTNSSRAVVTAISPDGKYVLTVMDDKGLNSLWLRNVATGSDTQVLPPGATLINVAFSPDGKQIAYPEFQPGAALGGINLFDLNSGKLQTLTFADKSIWEMTWSSAGDGLFVIYQQKGPNYIRRQIGYVSLADGRLRP